MNKQILTITALMLCSMVCSPAFSMALVKRDPIAAAIERSNAEEFKKAFQKQYTGFKADQAKQTIAIAPKKLYQLRADAYEAYEDRYETHNNRFWIGPASALSCLGIGCSSAIGLKAGLQGITNNSLGLLAFSTTPVLTETARQTAQAAKMFFVRNLAKNAGLTALAGLGIYASWKLGSQAYQAWHSEYYQKQAQSITTILEKIKPNETE